LVAGKAAAVVVVVFSFLVFNPATGAEKVA